MIGIDELEAAFNKVTEYQTDGPPWHENMVRMGFDPNAILQLSGEHGDFMQQFGQDSFQSMLSFGAGFTLAVVAINMQEGKND